MTTADDLQVTADQLITRSTGLFWVAVYLVELAWGGAEEGGWWFKIRSAGHGAGHSHRFGRTADLLPDGGRR